MLGPSPKRLYEIDTLAQSNSKVREIQFIHSERALPKRVQSSCSIRSNREMENGRGIDLISDNRRKDHLRMIKTEGSIARNPP